MSKETGGFAYPQDMVDIYGTRSSEGGMTLRDYFAGLAMQSIIRALFHGGIRDPTEEIVTKQAYVYADAMIAERDKP